MKGDPSYLIPQPNSDGGDAASDAADGKGCDGDERDLFEQEEDGEEDEDGEEEEPARAEDAMHTPLGSLSSLASLEEESLGEYGRFYSGTVQRCGSDPAASNLALRSPGRAPEGQLPGQEQAQATLLEHANAVQCDDADAAGQDDVSDDPVQDDVADRPVDLGRHNASQTLAEEQAADDAAQEHVRHDCVSGSVAPTPTGYHVVDDLVQGHEDEHPVSAWLLDVGGSSGPPADGLLLEELPATLRSTDQPKKALGAPGCPRVPQSAPGCPRLTVAPYSNAAGRCF